MTLERSLMQLLRVLIVEDNVLTADLLEMLAKEAGCTVVGVANSVEDAAELVQRSPPNLALVDVKLGGAVDGIAFAGELRGACDPRIVFVTGSGDPPTRRRIEAFRPFALVLKPYQPGQLVAQLERAALELKSAS